MLSLKYTTSSIFIWDRTGSVFLNPASFKDVQFLNFIEAITIKLVDTFRIRN